MPRLRRRIAGLYRRALRPLLQTLPEGELGRPAVVFSPHPDDETLGCGGTIIKKRRAGARIRIVLMTDGGDSHDHLMPRRELASIRAREMVAAVETLGLSRDDVSFLEFDDGRLGDSEAAASDRVLEILRELRPHEVYLPYSGDMLPDHGATNRAVVRALRRLDAQPAAYEYPIWFWKHWPWVREGASGARQRLRLVERALRCGAWYLRDFRWAVFVGDVLDLKRAALDAHRSQMTRLNGDPSWATLADVFDGDFLECFFQDYEIFHRLTL